MTVPFVHSGYARKENDDYQTVDARCIEALLESWPFIGARVADICSRDGSGILDYLSAHTDLTPVQMEDAFDDFEADWVITNPPYAKNVVDTFIQRGIDLIETKKIKGAAYLMRANFDLAKGRAKFFDSHLYLGQVRMRFRPWWSEDRKASPIHNFVWHVWGADAIYNSPPVIFYWP